MIGRDRELAELVAFVGTVAREGAGIAVVEGEAGIGKSTLLDHLADRLQATGTQVVRGRASELEQHRPHRVLEAALGEPSGDAGALVSPEDAIADAVEAAALAGPVVLLLDDLQWADGASLDAVSMLADRFADLPLAFVLACRPWPRPDGLSPLLAASGTTVALRPLSPDDVDELAGVVIGAAPGESVRAELHRSGGNPFFTLEVLDSLVRDARLRFEGGRAELADPSVPEGLRVAVRQRLDALPAGARRLLAAASVLGGDVEVDLLRAVAPEPDAFAEDLKALVASGELIGSVGSADDHLAFRHDLVRSTAAGDLAAGDAAALHLRVAEVLAASGAPATLVASHLVLADLGTADALQLLRDTAWALVRSAADLAIQLFTRGLEVLDESDPRWCDFAVGMLEPLTLQRRAPEAEALARRLLDGRLEGIAIEGPEADLASHARWSLYLALMRQENAARVVDEIVAMQQEPGLTDFARGWLDAALATTYVQLAQPADARVSAGRALAWAEAAGDDRVIAGAEAALAWAAAADGLVDEAVERTLRSSVAHRRLPHAYMTNEVFGGVVLLEADAFDDAVRFLHEGRNADVARGERAAVTAYHWAFVGRHYLAGAWDDAVAEFETGLRLMEAGGSPLGIVLARALRARIALHRDEHDVAASELALAQHALAAGEVLGGDLLLWCQALLLQRQGAADGALQLLEMAWHLTAPTRYFLSWRSMLPDTVALAVGLGRRDLALAVTEAAELGAERAGGLASARASALRCRGLLEGDADLLVRAVAAARRSPRRHDLGATAASAAAALAADGRKAEAVPLLHEALAEFDALGAAADAAPARALLDQLEGASSRARTRPVSGWSSLTPSELRVVELVVEGLTTPRIAERLFISRHTVDTHLKHVFVKLGVRSRVELAVLALRETS